METDNASNQTTLTYGYDALGRLTSESYDALVGDENDFIINYTYDLVGNRKTRTRVGADAETITYTYNSNDQLTTEVSNVNGTIGYVYDANGSLETKTSGGVTLTYTYDIAQRLVQLWDGHVTTHHYTYNDQGIRTSYIRKYEGDVKATTYYLIDPANPTGYAQVFEELDENRATTMTYTIGDDLLTQASSADVIRHFGYDGHGSTRLLTDENGDVKNTYDYEAYGYMANAGSAATKYLYVGEQYDANLAMYYLRARYYDPTIGRFNRIDPFAGDPYTPQSLHKYAYVHNNPINGIDPSGMEFSLTNLVINMTVTALLASIVYPHVLPRITRIAYELMPPWVRRALEGPVTAAVVGGGISGSSNLGSYPIQGNMSAGVDILIPVRPEGRGAAYFNWGWGLGFGGYGTSYSVEGYGGIVFNALNSADYTGFYMSLTFPFVGLPKKLRDAIITKLVTLEVVGLGGQHLAPLERWGLIEKYQKLKSKVTGAWDKVSTPVTISGWPGTDTVSVTIGLGYQIGGMGKSSDFVFGGGICFQLYPSDNVDL